MKMVKAGALVWHPSTSGIGGRWAPCEEDGLVFPGDSMRDPLYVPASQLQGIATELLALLKPKKGAR